MEFAEARARAAEMGDIIGKVATPETPGELEQLARGWELLADRARATAGDAADRRRR